MEAVYHRPAKGNLASIGPDRARGVTPAVDANLGRASAALYGVSTGSVLLCIFLWIRAKTIGEDERPNAERRALFVGLWPPMLWLMGDTARREHARRRRRGRRRR
jgi:hypothetical protein